jgi:hypothetical protein
MDIAKYNLAAQRIAAGEDETTVRAELGLAPTGAASPASPWSGNVRKDTRLDSEKLAHVLQQENPKLSDADALRAAIRMAPADAAPIIAQEDKRFSELAEREASKAWMDSPAGLEQLGKARKVAEASAAERASNIAAELAARGVPVEGMEPREVLGLVGDMEAKHAAEAEGNDLAANIAAATAGEAE